MELASLALTRKGELIFKISTLLSIFPLETPVNTVVTYCGGKTAIVILTLTATEAKFPAVAAGSPPSTTGAMATARAINIFLSKAVPPGPTSTAIWPGTSLSVLLSILISPLRPAAILSRAGCATAGETTAGSSRRILSA